MSVGGAVGNGPKLSLSSMATNGSLDVQGRPPAFRRLVAIGGKADVALTPHFGSE
jgi:hypothetical protein